MYVKQVDFFMGTGMTFVNKVMHMAIQQAFHREDCIFRIGDPARRLYVLLEGRVRLTLGRQSHVVYVVSRGGEAFGWSSLVGGAAYSASAACVEPTRVLFFDRDQFQEILHKDPVNGMALYKGLAKTLAARLMETYRMLGRTCIASQNASLGSGQFGGSNADGGPLPAYSLTDTTPSPPPTQWTSKVPK